MVVVVFSGIQGPLLATILNRQVTSDVRATVMSLQNLLLTLSVLAADPLAGFVVDRWGFRTSFLGLTGFLVLSGWPLLLLVRHYPRQDDRILGTHSQEGPVSRVTPISPGRSDQYERPRAGSPDLRRSTSRLLQKRQPASTRPAIGAVRSGGSST